MNLTLSVTEKPGDKSALKRLNRLAELSTKVGVLAEGEGLKKHDPQAPLTVAEIAAVHEFGSPKNKIPERSFMRATLKKNEQKYISFMASQIKLVIEKKMNPKIAMARLGALLASDMQRSIVAGIAPPLSAFTLRQRSLSLKAKKNQGGVKRPKKSSFKPLFDTGQIIRAITYKTIQAGALNP